MKSAAKYALALLALAAAVAPIYWLVTISIKRDIDQFAVAAAVVSLSADGAALRGIVQ
jgi:hypothetical protein